jgi:hypothetical protein
MTMRAFEERVGYILLLFCMAVMAAIVYWYPVYVHAHSGPLPLDYVYGSILLWAFPFWFIGPGVTLWAMFRLWRAVIRGERTIANGFFAVCGGLLAVVGFSPLVMFAWGIAWDILFR